MERESDANARAVRLREPVRKGIITVAVAMKKISARLFLSLASQVCEGT